MFEENSYEPLAEVYLSLGDENEGVYLLCSRVVIRGKEEEILDLPEIQEVKLETNHEAHPFQVKKKDHEEILSCYCSASHCSTDEHDSVRENALHSDSGADLSESSKDLDWERYWTNHGERIVWESWIKKYGEYIDPNYVVAEADPEETQFNISSGEVGKKNFLGLLDDVSDADEFRVRSNSRSSKSSVMTDSLTNITPMTIYSSESSCQEESGLSNSNSVLSSVDSISSNDQQWQQIWLDHYTEILNETFRKFMSKANGTPSEVYDSVFDDLKSSSEPTTEIKVDAQKEEKEKSINLKEVHSVGYLLGSLQTLSMDQETTKDSISETDITEIDTISEPVSEMATKRGSKRAHEKDDPSLDRVKGAFTLMGFVFKPQRPEKSSIRKAQVVYRKKNIRSHNRSLNLKAIQPRHIRFDEDGGEMEENENPFQSSAVQRFFPYGDDFSEKDDSSSEDFFTAEDPSAKKEKQKKKKMSKKKRNNLPKEILDNKKLLKYWYKRYRLFSLYDQGILLDEESWYSVTPEKVSKHTAERCRCDLIIDACCGAGGNTIQFAFTCEKVIAIDIDPAKIELARHNAKVYGVDDRIDFIVGDFLKLAPTLKADVVFLSPPWGGPSYLADESFGLDKITVDGGGETLFNAASAITPNIAYFLPKNINTDQLVKMVPGGAVEVEQNFLDKQLVAVTAYFGDLVETV